MLASKESSVNRHADFPYLSISLYKLFDRSKYVECFRALRWSGVNDWLSKNFAIFSLYLVKIFSWQFFFCLPKFIDMVIFTMIKIIKYRRLNFDNAYLRLPSREFPSIFYFLSRKLSNRLSREFAVNSFHSSKNIYQEFEGNTLVRFILIKLNVIVYFSSSRCGCKYFSLYNDI